MNPDLICPPYILWSRRVRAGSDPSSPDPQLVVTHCATRRRAISAVVAQSPPSSPEQHPSSPDPVPVVGRCVPVVASFLFNSRTRRRELSTRRRAVRTRRCEVRNPSLRPFPRPPRTRPRASYKYAQVLLFPRTLLEHPGLHLPRRLLAGFSKGCFIFFIARHPPRLEFREHSAVQSALVILDYLEIKHYFFFSLGLLALE